MNRKHFLQISQMDKGDGTDHLMYTVGNWQEPIDADTPTGDIYRDAMREYGRCIGKIYVDNPASNEPRAVGWVFVKRQYGQLVETWVSPMWEEVATGYIDI